MTKAEWALWITSTVFQGILAIQVILESRKAEQFKRLIEKSRGIRVDE